MTVEIDYTPIDFHGSDTGNDAPETVRLRIATEAKIEELLEGAKKASIRVPVIPAAPTKRMIVTIPVTPSASQYAHWYPPEGVTPTAYKFVRGGTAAGTCTVALDRITKSTGAVATALSTAVNVAAGTNDVEQSFAPSVAIAGANHALTSAQGLKITVAAGAGASPPPITFIVEYVDTSAVSGKGQASWFPGKDIVIAGYTVVLPETFVGASLVANLDAYVATTGVLTQLGTSQSIAGGTKDVETAYVPDETAGALPYTHSALKGLRFEVVADATVKAPTFVTFHVTYSEVL